MWHSVMLSLAATCFFFVCLFGGGGGGNIQSQSVGGNVIQLNKISFIGTWSL